MPEMFGTPIDDDETTEAAPARRILASDGSTEKTPFDYLKEEAAKEIERFVTYENTERPGWFMKFNAVIDGEEIKRYQKAAQGRKKRPEDADMIRGNVVMLAEKNTALMRGTATLTDSDGDDLTFTSEDFVDLFADESGTIESALKKFLGDAQIMKLGGAVLREGGYEDDLQPVDPTNG